MLYSIEQLKEAGFIIEPRADDFVRISHPDRFYYFHPAFQRTVAEVVASNLSTHPAGAEWLVMPLPADGVINLDTAVVFMLSRQFDELLHLSGESVALANILNEAKAATKRNSARSEQLYQELVGSL